MRKNLDFREKKEGSLPYVEINSPGEFKSAKIFDCGQCFRFNRANNSRHEVEFSGVAYGKFLSVAQSGEKIYIYNSTAKEFENLWCHYLGLDTDYEAIISDIASRSGNPALGAALEFGKGIRILAQEPFETVISFIISQNNNIPRIKKIIENLSETYGKKIDLAGIDPSHLAEGCKYFTFPRAEDFLAAGVEGIYNMRVGFRAKYIYDAAKKFSDGTVDLSRIFAEASTEKCIEELCLVKGIGLKVASCALLFGFGRYDAFPVDVWIKKVIAKYFDADPSEFDYRTLGPFAGIAQQYLFYYERYGTKNAFGNASAFPK